GPTVTRLQLAQLGVEVPIGPADPVDDLSLDPSRKSGQDVDQAVRVRGDEVDRRIARPQLIHRGRDGQPPPARVAREPEVTSADEPEHDPAFGAPDRVDVWLAV